MKPDIAETIAHWLGDGIGPATVWEAVTGRPPHRIPTWEEVGLLLEQKSPRRKAVPTVGRVVDGVSWREAA